MGGALTDAVWIFAVVLVLIVLAAAAIASRRFLLERSGGTVECGLRLVPRASWRLGLLSYQRDELCWYGALGVLLRPAQVFHRRSLAVVARRPADLAEAAALGADRIIVEVSTGDDAHVELAMTEEALTGFLAWLEASPPGSHLADIALQAPKARNQAYPERSRGFVVPIVLALKIWPVMGGQSFSAISSCCRSGSCGDPCVRTALRLR